MVSRERLCVTGRFGVNVSETTEVAIVAALEREIWPLVKDWPREDRIHDGREFRFFRKDRLVAVCGGIGPVAARRAAEAAIVSYRPGVVQSVGFAGALVPTLRVGEVVMAARVVDAGDGSSVETGEGTGVLVTSIALAGVEQKGRLARSYGAGVVDMEAAAVAKAAEARGLRFRALKAISDENDFALPNVEKFVRPDGRFDTARFGMHVAMRPWLWFRVFRLATNSSKAAAALCDRLSELYGLRGV
nr:5'-methylthioadenosine/S-adenosylhomocysteine nucleosidase [uncultured bacterium]